MVAPERGPHVVEVTAGLIRDERGRYLITRRTAGSHLEGLWEFPGGKREVGESLEQCLRRELTEELGAEFTVGDRVETVTWRYPDKTIALHFFRCRLAGGEIAPQEGQAHAWVEPGRLSDYAFPPADSELIARLRAEA
jgi:8-oxo-dGTP diphosphatase